MSLTYVDPGVSRGQTIGATDLEGGEVVDRGNAPADYARTIYRKLGIDTTARRKNADADRLHCRWPTECRVV